MPAPKAESSATRIVFLDTEFTGLTGKPLLLSVGLVAGGSEGLEFYAEVTDESRLGAASAFTRNVVLPQFGRVAGAACTYAELGGRVAGFLDALTFPRVPGRRIAVAYESDRDWALVERAVRHCDEKRWLDFRAWLQPVNVYNVGGFAAGERAADAYFDAQRAALLGRHHALCDARALRIAHEAATASTASTACQAALAERFARESSTEGARLEPRSASVQVGPPRVDAARPGTQS